MRHLKHCILAITLTVALFYGFGVSNTVNASSSSRAQMVDDALIPPDIPPRHNSPITPGYYETSEYLIGNVSVGVILLESNGTIDSSTENWTSTEEANVISEIKTGLTWWSNQNPSARVNFIYDIHFGVPTSYEPIRHSHNAEGLWISEAMTSLGYTGTSYFTQARDYINALRNSSNIDWSFAIFVVDSSNDPDGNFADWPTAWFAYAYLGGPFLVMTYDNNGWGISRMDRIAAHECGHIFYATDEYNGRTEYSGYLNVSDVEYSGDLMDRSSLSLSSGTRGQVGWRDSDGDAIQDIVDTFPNTTLHAYLPDPTNSSSLTYSGIVEEVPYPNRNPHGTGRDVTINTILNVQHRVNSTAWANASATDGSFDEAEENFTFTVSSSSSGVYFTETRGMNSVANTETSFDTDMVTVDLNPPITSINYSFPNYTKDATVHVSKDTTFTLNASDALTGVAKTYYNLDSGTWTQYAAPFTVSGTPDGTHTLHRYSLDNTGNQETTKSLSIVIDNTAPTISPISPSNGSALKSSNVNLSWIGSDDGSGIAHYEVRIGEGDYTSKGLSTSHTFSGVAEGNHTTYIRAFDKLGNQEETTVILIVDTTPPLISITSPDNESQIKSPVVALSWSGLDEVTGITNYRIRLDGALWIDLETNTTYAFAQVDDGGHTVDIAATDKAGNYRQVRIHLLINTSLIGGPGWTDDILIFGAIGAVALIAIGFFIIKRRRKRDSILDSTPSDLASNT